MANTDSTYPCLVLPLSSSSYELEDSYRQSSALRVVTSETGNKPSGKRFSRYQSRSANFMTTPSIFTRRDKSRIRERTDHSLESEI